MEGVLALPDLEIDLLRGNVATRVRKVTDGEFDATLLSTSQHASVIRPILEPFGLEPDIELPDTDIIFGVKGRTWENCDGKVNFPDGEVFTGPIEDSTSARTRSTPSRSAMSRP